MAPVVTTDDEVVLAVLAHPPVCVLLLCETRVCVSPRSHLDSWINAPPRWAQPKMGQKCPLNPTPIEGSNAPFSLGSRAGARVLIGGGEIKKGPIL